MITCPETHTLVLVEDKSQSHRLYSDTRRDKPDQFISFHNSFHSEIHLFKNNRNTQDGQVWLLCGFINELPPQFFAETFLGLSMVKDGGLGIYKPSIRAFIPQMYAWWRSWLIHLDEPRLAITGRFSSRFGDFGVLPLDYEEWHSFSVSGIDLLQHSTQEFVTFEGSNKLKFLCNQPDNPEMYQEFVFEYCITLTWKGFVVNSSPAENVMVLGKVLQQKLFTDCVIVASNKKEVACHRNIIAAQSDVLLVMLMDGPSESHGRIELSDVSEEGVNALIAYFYGKTVDLDEIGGGVALELLHTANMLKVLGLENFLVNTLCSKKESWFSLEIAISFYELTKNVEAFKMLYVKMVQILKRNATGLRSSEAYIDFLNRSPKEAADLALLLAEKLSGIRCEEIWWA